jgi:hypothetical protein
LNLEIVRVGVDELVKLALVQTKLVSHLLDSPVFTSVYVSVCRFCDDFT